jgi:hypothetical protein
MCVISKKGQDAIETLLFIARQPLDGGAMRYHAIA